MNIFIGVLVGITLAIVIMIYFGRIEKQIIIERIGFERIYVDQRIDALRVEASYDLAIAMRAAGFEMLLVGTTSGSGVDVYKVKWVKIDERKSE